MKAQKLLFYTHGWHLAVTGQPAIDKPFEVWQYGPVVSSIYHELSRFGGGAITEYIKEYDPRDGSYKAFVVNPVHKKFYEVLDLSWEKYIGISAIRLSAMTHEPNSPWDIAHSRHESIIRDSDIREYFVGIAGK